MMNTLPIPRTISMSDQLRARRGQVAEIVQTDPYWRLRRPATLNAAIAPRMIAHEMAAIIPAIPARAMPTNEQWSEFLSRMLKALKDAEIAKARAAEIETLSAAEHAANMALGWHTRKGTNNPSVFNNTLTLSGGDYNLPYHNGEPADGFIIAKIEEILKFRRRFKLAFITRAEFAGPSDRYIITHWGAQMVITRRTDLQEIVSHARTAWVEYVETSMGHTSGLTFTQFEDITLSVSSYNPLDGKSYIQLPDVLTAKRGILNIDNNDARCFEYATKAGKSIHLNGSRLKSARASTYDDIELNYDGLEFPVSVSAANFRRFERNNPEIMLNVMSLEMKPSDYNDAKRAGVYAKALANIDMRIENTAYSALKLVLKELKTSALMKSLKSKTKISAGMGCADVVAESCDTQTSGATSTTYAIHTSEYRRAILQEFIDEAEADGDDADSDDVCGGDDDERARDSDKDKVRQLLRRVDVEYVSDKPEGDGKYWVDLLVVSICGVRHYTTITNYRGFLTGGGSKRNHLYTCRRCLTSNCSVEKHEAHIRDCAGFNAKIYQRAVLPAYDSIITYSDGGREKRSPYVAYCDFEAFNIGINDETQAGKITQRIATQKACGAAYTIIDASGHTAAKEMYRGDNVAEWLISSLASFANNAAINDPACADKKWRMPAFIHNLKGYDAHLIVQVLNERYGELSAIPLNPEKFLSLGAGRVVFKDSMAFMLSSLSGLVDNLKHGVASAEELRLKFPSCAELADELSATITADAAEVLDIVCAKGVYPYEYVSDAAVFDETCLPPHAAFYSVLAASAITDEEYQRAIKVFARLECRDIGDYHDIYLKTDVALLADIFEAFRNTMMKSHGLDPACYISAPGFSWDAMLKHTKIEMEQITCGDMYMFFERGVRGGQTFVVQHSAYANNPHVPNYDASKPHSWIMYQDANNLYGGAMCEKLPIECFEWVEPSKIEAEYLAIDDTKEGDSRGMTLEICGYMPAGLHDAFNEFPLAPDVYEPTYDDLSPLQQSMKDASLYISARKLIGSFLPLKNYVLHHKALKFYQSLGLVVSQYVRAVSYTEAAFLKPYIDLNTRLRAAASNDFEKDLYKLLNNSVFGKTMENKRARRDIQLMNPAGKKFSKWSNCVSFKGRTIINPELVIAERAMKTVKLDKPIYVGQAILDISKIHMYNHHYNVMKPRYGKDVKLLYSDTDSFVYHITTHNVYDDFGAGVHGSAYDTSNYPKDSPYFSKENAKVLGKFKDECAGEVVDSFVALKAKMYSLKTVCDGHSVKKAKGTKRSVVADVLTHADYESVLRTKETRRDLQTRLTSKDHQIYTLSMNKVSLDAFDTKRYMLADGVNTMAYGHYRIAA